MHRTMTPPCTPNHESVIKNQKSCNQAIKQSANQPSKVAMDERRSRKRGKTNSASAEGAEIPTPGCKSNRKMTITINIRYQSRLCPSFAFAGRGQCQASKPKGGAANCCSAQAKFSRTSVERKRTVEGQSQEGSQEFCPTGARRRI